MELAIDAGNTHIKVALFINNGIHKLWKVRSFHEDIQKELKSFPIKHAIMSSTRKKEDLATQWFTLVESMLWLDHTTPLPFRNSYQTPETLGKDRLAAVAGGRFLYPDAPILAVDAGTCITYDLLTEGDEYLGGNISPGIHLRLQALHHFTGALPLINFKDTEELIGTNTNDAILTGVLQGYRGEVDSRISAYKKRFPKLKTILCGGDAKYLVNHLENEIFASQNLVLLGLHKILRHNL